MSVIGLVLLAAAIVLLGVAEWPRLSPRAPKLAGRRPRRRHLHVVEPETEPDDFQRAVERDLANLPTYDPNERRRTP
jgi:hypothetical protein